MSAFQALTLMRNTDVAADQHGLDEGRMINGQKILIQIISGTVEFSAIGMHELFRSLTT
jgi:hypothetical protein